MRGDGVLSGKLSGSVTEFAGGGEEEVKADLSFQLRQLDKCWYHPLGEHSGSGTNSGRREDPV